MFGPFTNQSGPLLALFSCLMSVLDASGGFSDIHVVHT